MAHPREQSLYIFAKDFYKPVYCQHLWKLQLHCLFVCLSPRVALHAAALWCCSDLEQPLWYCGVGWVKTSKQNTDAGSIIVQLHINTLSSCRTIEIMSNILKTVCLVSCTFAFLQDTKLSLVIWSEWVGSLLCLVASSNSPPFHSARMQLGQNLFHSSETSLLDQWMKIRCQLYPISNIGPEGCSSVQVDVQGIIWGISYGLGRGCFEGSTFRLSSISIVIFWGYHI